MQRFIQEFWLAGGNQPTSFPGSVYSYNRQSQTSH